MSWKYFNGNYNEDQPESLAETTEREDQPQVQAELPDRRPLPDIPPWRQFLDRKELDAAQDKIIWDKLRQIAQKDDRSIQRGKSFRLTLDKNGYSEIVDAVNAAIHLRRPLLVTGLPGSGKTTLAYAIAHELQLGSVLTWPITARSNLVDAEYRYDAIARLQDAQLDKTRQPDKEAEKTPQNEPKSPEEAEQTPKNQPKPREEGDLGDYIQLGPVGTAFLPSLWPRVLLIDEIDKSDLNLPNDLLNLFEEGEFEIPELVRRKRHRGNDQEKDFTVEVRTADPDRTAFITNGRVKCCEFPLVIMTSNGEREFPPAFYRRCLRVKMPNPTPESLVPIVRSHFNQIDQNGWTKTEQNLKNLIAKFLEGGNKADRATDQLLNAIYLMTRNESPSEEEMKQLQKLLFRRLSEVDG